MSTTPAHPRPAAQTPAVPALRVGIQGYAGAFHETAARRYYGEDFAVSIVPGHTFADVVEQVESGKSDTALMAIENTLAGSLMQNYHLLQEAKLKVVGEVYLRIRQNLMALPGVELHELREVYSHPIALMQCREFFRQWPRITLIEDADTALSARDVLKSEDRTRGAVASSTAAELYGLEILAPSIETNKLNHTRFLVLERGREVDFGGGDKVSLSFSTAHASGSLMRVLTVLAAYDVNLTKIQSTPIVGRPWEYRFYVDFIVEGAVDIKTALDAIAPITTELRVLGVYASGEKP